MIGTDLVDKRRIAQQWQNFGERFARFVLHPEEYEELGLCQNVPRFLAMRWAAKEALAKALKTGLRHPVLMRHMALRHDAQGAPYLHVEAGIEALLAGRRIDLSLSDERHYALAFVVLRPLK